MNRKYIYIGVPLSVLSGIFLTIDVVHQDLPDITVTVFMLLAIVGLFICFKGGAFKT